MLKGLIQKVTEVKDTQYDYNEQFEIAVLPDKKAIVVTQLFGYNTKYPIYVETDGNIADKIAKIKKYDIDVTLVSITGKGEDLALQLIFDIDSKELENILTLRLILANGKEKIQEV